MAVLLLGGVYFLSGKGAQLVNAQKSGAKVVVLDAGHGGDDPGKIGVNQVNEKDVNLVIADKVKKELEAKGITARVLDMHTIKPLDTEAVTACINEIGKVITVEDHNILNGLGSAVCEVAAEMGKGVVKRIGVQDQYGQSAPYERLLAMNGITVENIVKTAEELQ